MYAEKHLAYRNKVHNPQHGWHARGKTVDEERALPRWGWISKENQEGEPGRWGQPASYAGFFIINQDQLPSRTTKGPVKANPLPKINTSFQPDRARNSPKA